MGKFRLAVAIPASDGAVFVQAPLQNVFAQTESAGKVTVASDDSTDDELGITEKMAMRHLVSLLQRKDGGQSSAINLVIGYRRSSYIAFLGTKTTGSGTWLTADTLQQTQDVCVRCRTNASFLPDSPGWSQPDDGRQFFASGLDGGVWPRHLGSEGQIGGSFVCGNSSWAIDPRNLTPNHGLDLDQIVMNRVVDQGVLRIDSCIGDVSA